MEQLELEKELRKETVCATAFYEHHKETVVVQVHPSAIGGYAWVSVVKNGVADYLRKPILIEAIRDALPLMGADLERINRVHYSSCQKLKEHPYSNESRVGGKRAYGGFVYFMSGAGLIKIGVASDVSERLKTINAMSPVHVSLIGYTDGGCELEVVLHKKFAQKRVHGEWFAIEPSEIKEYLR